MTGRLALIGAVAAALAAGCGAGPDAAAPSEAGATSQGAATAVSAFPVTIDHAFGETVIPAEPQKIVTLGLSDQDPLLALGVVPVAVYPWYGDYEYGVWPWAQGELGDAEPVVLNGGVRDEANPPIEEIAALEPDLILSLYNGTTRAQYDLLSEIAPVVVPTEEFGDFTITWQEATRVTGQALGRGADADALVADVEDAFAAAAVAHPEFAGQEVVVAERFEGGQSVVRTGNDTRARFFELLGFDPVDEIAGRQPDEFGEIMVSDELLPEMSRDLLVWNIGFAPEERAVIEALPIYATLPVVADDRVLWIEDPEIAGAFTWGTVLSLSFALDQMLPRIADVMQTP